MMNRLRQRSDCVYGGFEESISSDCSDEVYEEKDEELQQLPTQLTPDAKTA
jgi:hypothetical protein